jgi:hypothetical protein
MRIPFVLMALLSLTLACKKDKTFCIENVSISRTVPIGEADFTLPNGQRYAGQGAPPVATTFGDYTGTFQSVVTSQTQTATGQDVALVHFFDDGEGNTFWTNDEATFTPTDNTFTIFQVDNTMTIVGGTGDFDCANGQFSNQGLANFVTGTLQVNITGKVCGGCEE